MPKPLISLRTIIIFLGISVVITICSYGIVTGRNVAEQDATTITGDYIVNLPCMTSDPNWHSDKPLLPEARGIPFNYNFWNPCYGNKILLNGFLLDIGFWFIVAAGGHAIYTLRKQRLNNNRTTP
jgi:hypothetical protein